LLPRLVDTEWIMAIGRPQLVTNDLLHRHVQMKDANRDAFTPKGFELEAGRIGRLVREQYRIGFVDVGGCDTHVNEGSAQRARANNVDSLGRGLAALAQELGGEWRNTVVAVVSEFGRTFRENGNRETDHGHARSTGCSAEASTVDARRRAIES